MAISWTQRYLVILSLFVTLTSQAVEVSPEVSPYIKDGGDKLSYGPINNAGDRILDFSYAGYKGGGVPLPTPEDMPHRITITPTGNNDNVLISQAIGQLGSMPLNDKGFRGEVYLEAGTYDIQSNIPVYYSGISIRGAGKDKTILMGAYGSSSKMFSFYTRSAVARASYSGSISEARLGDLRVTYTPSTNGTVIKPGDTVEMGLNTNNLWLADTGMDSLTNPWTPGARGIIQKTAVSITDNPDGTKTVLLDAPIENAIQSKYGGGYIGILPYDPNPDIFWRSGPINNVGISNLTCISKYETGSDGLLIRNNMATSIYVAGVNDFWIENINCINPWTNGINILPWSRRGTIRKVHVEILNRGFMGTQYFSGVGIGLRASQVLVDLCSVGPHTRHAFLADPGSGGLNAFVDILMANAGSEAGHQRWATGMLFDRMGRALPQDTSSVLASSRHNMGSGHGWASVNSIIWNSSVNDVSVASPRTPDSDPIQRNMMIGGLYKKVISSVPNDTRDHIASGILVTPDSLYLQQLIDRFGKDHVKNLVKPYQWSGYGLAPHIHITFARSKIRAYLAELGKEVNQLTNPDDFQLRWTTNIHTPPQSWNIYTGDIRKNPTTTYYLTVEILNPDHRLYGLPNPIAVVYPDYHTVEFFADYGIESSFYPPATPKPTAVIEPSHISGIPPLTVNFDARNSSTPNTTITSYEWNFGDGTTANGPQVSHSFQQGIHRVTLKVTDDQGASDTETITITSGPIQTLQAEDASLVASPTENNHIGFNGTGFVNMAITGSSIEWTNIDGGNGGARTIKIRYALGSTTNRTASLSINGAEQPIEFAPTGAWNNWKIIEIQTNLLAGLNNTIKIQTTGQDSGNIDELIIPVFSNQVINPDGINNITFDEITNKIRAEFPESANQRNPILEFSTDLINWAEVPDSIKKIDSDSNKPYFEAPVNLNHKQLFYRLKME